MKAIQFREHGTSDVLEYVEIDRPIPGSGQVLIAVRAVSVNRGPDVETRQQGFAMGALPLPHTGGIDPAGDIVALGRDVEGFVIGDRVAVYPVIACGACDFCVAGADDNRCRNFKLFGVQTPGGRAEFVCAPASQLVRLPNEVSYDQAAALGVAYTTTWHGVSDRGKVTAEDTFLVMGAGGACGVAAVQLGLMVGARVIAVTGAAWKQERLRQLGAHEVFSYRDSDWIDRVRAATGGRGVTVAFDNSGTATLPSSIECLDRGGRLFCSGGTTGLQVTLNVRNLYRDHIDLRFYVQGAKRNMEHLVELVAMGALDPIISERFTLRDAARADDYLEGQHQFGRVVLTVPSEDGCI
jgi:acryloyl-coenzyme A reductase